MRRGRCVALGQHVRMCCACERQRPAQHVFTHSPLLLCICANKRLLMLQLQRCKRADVAACCQLQALRCAAQGGNIVRMTKCLLRDIAIHELSSRPCFCFCFASNADLALQSR